MKSLEFLGYKGYAVTECGKVYSFKTNKFIGCQSGGYRMVSLTRDGWSKPHLIHRLVALAYLEPVEGKDVVNHKDGNKVNNHFTNLEWCTYSENAIHAIETGLRGAVKNDYRPVSDDTAAQVCKLLEDGARNKDICESLNVSNALVSGIKSGAIYKDISEGFNFRKVPSSNRISEAKVILICEELQSTPTTINVIAKKYNVSHGVVRRIKERAFYTYISNNYTW